MQDAIFPAWSTATYGIRIASGGEPVADGSFEDWPLEDGARATAQRPQLDLRSYGRKYIAAKRLAMELGYLVKKSAAAIELPEGWRVGLQRVEMARDALVFNKQLQYFTWEAQIPGYSGTQWEGHTFRVLLYFPSDYPMSRPFVRYEASAEPRPEGSTPPSNQPSTAYAHPQHCHAHSAPRPSVWACWCRRDC